jgi:hypothetical protein
VVEDLHALGLGVGEDRYGETGVNAPGFQGPAGAADHARIGREVGGEVVNVSGVEGGGERFQGVGPVEAV